MADSEDREHYLVMQKLRWSRRVPWAMVGVYLIAMVGFSILHYTFEPNTSVVESVIVANTVCIVALLLSSPLLVALWFFGVLGRDLLLGIRRRIWGIKVEEIPEMLTSPIEDPDPIASARVARDIRLVHREARAKSSGPRFIR